jgi:hypothetical protein
MNNLPDDVDFTNPAAIRECLDYLYAVMMYERMTFPALLVGAAALALDDLDSDVNSSFEPDEAENICFLKDIKDRESI